MRVCKNCGKTWAGHDRYCPENPVKGHKWDSCACYVHTCFYRQPGKREG